MAFIPYLNFDGTTREAFTRYQEIFGGELMIMTGADAPPADEQSGDGVPPEMADMVIHAALTVGDSILMASDTPPGAGVVVQGTYVNHTADDVDEARRVYDALMKVARRRCRSRRRSSPRGSACCAIASAPCGSSTPRRPTRADRGRHRGPVGTWPGCVAPGPGSFRICDAAQ